MRKTIALLPIIPVFVFGLLYHTYNKGFSDGKEYGKAELDTSWSLYYDKNHLPYEDGYVLISQMPYEGFIQFAGENRFTMGERIILSAGVYSKSDKLLPDEK